MLRENSREFILSSRDLINDYWCRIPRLPQLLNIKRYMIVGLFLTGLYGFQYLSGMQWAALGEWQGNMVYKQISGYILLALFLYQWQLSRVRNLEIPGEQRAVLKNHKWIGAILTLPFFFHAMQPGYGYLYLLTASFLLCVTSGLFNVETVRIRCKACLFVWTLLHILVAVATLLLVVFHIYVVYAYS